ncbi:protein of unknown function (plasmid) [Caballeronia sp. S22]
MITKVPKGFFEQVRRIEMKLHNGLG